MECDELMEPAVKLVDVYKSFEGRLVLAGVTLEAYWGEITAIVGPNGCGKTTLLRIVAGLEKPDKGLVEVKGKPLMVFQENLLLPWKKLRDNVALGLIYRGIAKRRAYQVVEEVARLLGFEEHLDKYPWQVSGGTARKAAIARILVLNPDIILLDEPLASLDAKTRNILLNKMRMLAAREGKAVIIVDHAIDHVASYTDRLYVLTPPPTRVRKTVTLHHLNPNEKIRAVYMALAEQGS